jgi:proton-coupled amino acid transporter
LTTILILGFSTYKLVNEGWGNNIQAFNKATWLTMIGSSIYAYEGFGTILPLLDVAEKPELFSRTLFMVLATVFGLYTSFGVYCYLVYGDKLVDPLITANLQPQGLLVYAIKIAYCFNLVLTFPLTVYPANIIIESYIFAKMQPSKKRTWLKNLSRTLVSFAVVATCMAVGVGVDKFISLSGSIACTPISLTLPAIFHLKLAGELTKTQKIIDYCIIGLSLVILVYCTGFTLVTWND